MKLIQAFLLGMSPGPILVATTMLAAVITGWSGYPGWGRMAVIVSSILSIAGGVIAAFFAEMMAR